jgi:hypothetical protein
MRRRKKGERQEEKKQFRMVVWAGKERKTNVVANHLGVNGHLSGAIFLLPRHKTE